MNFFTIFLLITFKILFCWSVSRKCSERSSESTRPLTKLSHSWIKSSQLSMMKTRLMYNLMLFVSFGFQTYHMVHVLGWTKQHDIQVGLQRKNVWQRDVPPSHWWGTCKRHCILLWWYLLGFNNSHSFFSTLIFFYFSLSSSSSILTLVHLPLSSLLFFLQWCHQLPLLWLFASGWDIGWIASVFDEIIDSSLFQIVRLCPLSSGEWLLFHDQETCRKHLVWWWSDPQLHFPKCIVRHHCACVTTVTLSATK